MSGWDQYISGMIQNKQLPDGSWLQNVVQEAAILTFDGTVAAATAGFTLKAYEYDIKVDDTNTKKVPVNEKDILLALILNGDSKKCEAGIRINNVKYMLANYDKENKLAYLSKTKGGACIMCSKSMIIYAAYSTDAKMSDGKPQNAGNCNNAVENTVKALLASGA